VLRLVEVSRRRFASGGEDRKVLIWDRQGDSWENTAAFQEQGVVYGLARLANGHLFVCTDCSISAWDITTLKGHYYDQASVPTLAWSKEGRVRRYYYATTLRNGNVAVCVWDPHEVLIVNAATGTTIATLEGHEDIVNCVVELSDGRLVSASGAGEYCVWSPSGELLKSLKSEVLGAEYVHSVVELSDGRVASAGGNKVIQIWD